jgi:hypothetical protein
MIYKVWFSCSLDAGEDLNEKKVISLLFNDRRFRVMPVCM